MKICDTSAHRKLVDSFRDVRCEELDSESGVSAKIMLEFTWFSKLSPATYDLVSDIAGRFFRPLQDYMAKDVFFFQEDKKENVLGRLDYVHYDDEFEEEFRVYAVEES